MTTTNLIGFSAALLTTLSFVPQAVRILKTRETRAISLSMYLLFNLVVFLWMIYGFLLMEWPIIIANGITFLLTLMVLIMKIRLG